VTEHYTAATEEVRKWCNRCARVTAHAVSGGRIGRCMEHESGSLQTGESQKQTKAREQREHEARNPKLFE